MATHFTFVPEGEWVKGDYRYGAHLEKGACSVEGLATVVGASALSFVEDGLGPGKAFGVRSEAGRQVAFEEYEHGVGVNVLVLFEEGACKRSDTSDVLKFFGISERFVTWYAPETIDG